MEALYEASPVCLATAGLLGAFGSTGRNILGVRNLKVGLKVERTNDSNPGSLVNNGIGNALI
jgi:hypothetical protein